MVMRVTTEYLIDQRVREELIRADVVAADVAAYLAAPDAAALTSYLVENGRNSSVRMLVIGQQGTVLADGHASLTGARLGHGEVTDILDGLLDRSYGFHRIQDGNAQEWVGYFTSVIIYDAQKIGVAMISTSIQDLIDQLIRMQTTLMLYFAVMVALVIYLSAMYSGIITRPINRLTQVIDRTSRGDFSVRANPKGHDEIARLGRTFNMMSERLEQQDRMRSDFISNASHELKTPLSAMKILVESLIHQKEFDPEITKDFLGDVNNEIDRLSRIVTDLLVLVRFDSQNAILKVGTVPLMALLEDTSRRLKPVAEEGEIQLSVHPHAEMYVLGDREKLQQVFYNLMDNAIKYTPAGGRVRVEASRSGSDAVVAVRDTGIGIAEEDLPHVFERFFRVDKARSRATGGTGLGLSIAKNIAVLHGGDILVDSQEGTGTTFTVMLPIDPNPFAEQEETH